MKIIAIDLIELSEEEIIEVQDIEEEVREVVMREEPIEETEEDMEEAPMITMITELSLTEKIKEKEVQTADTPYLRGEIEGAIVEKIEVDIEGVEEVITKIITTKEVAITIKIMIEVTTMKRKITISLEMKNMNKFKKKSLKLRS